MPSLPRKTKVAILVDNKPLFASGIIQQTLFTYQCLSRIDNCAVALVSSDPTYISFGHETGLFPSVPVTHLSADNLEAVLADISVFICLSSNINTDEKTLARVKALGIKIVENICGNYYILDQERFALGQHSEVTFYRNSNDFDEYWLLPMYDFARSYIETMTHRPVHVVPYVWGPDIVDAWMQKKSGGVDIRWRLASHAPEVPPTALIAEPNVSIHKTALVPLAICEQHHWSGGALAKAFCLASIKGNASDSARQAIISRLSIHQRGLVECYPRMELFDVLRQLTMVDSQPILVSHQIMNDLNFLQLELFYLGYPVVHNCERLRDAGYYYEGCDVAAGVEQLRTCIDPNTAQTAPQARALAQKVMWRFAPTNPENVQAYATRLAHLLDS